MPKYDPREEILNDLEEVGIEKKGAFAGWSNEETQIVAFWTQNSEPMYNRIVNFVREGGVDVYDLHRYLEDMFVYEMPPMGATVYGDLLVAAMEEVNFREIAEYWIEELGADVERDIS